MRYWKVYKSAGVIFLTRDDGKLEIWDLLEATHQPAAEVPVSSAPLTTCAFDLNALGHSRSRQLLAVGEATELLHLQFSVDALSWMPKGTTGW